MVKDWCPWTSINSCKDLTKNYEHPGKHFIPLWPQEINKQTNKTNFSMYVISSVSCDFQSEFLTFVYLNCCKAELVKFCLPVWRSWVQATAKAVSFPPVSSGKVANYSQSLQVTMQSNYFITQPQKNPTHEFLLCGLLNIISIVRPLAIKSLPDSIGQDLVLMNMSICVK